MRFWLKGNVTIPRRPSTVGGLIGWSRGVNRALTELRDRKIEGTVVKSRGGGGGSDFNHQWQVTAATASETNRRYNVRAGIAVIQGTRTEVAAVSDLVGGLLSEESGYTEYIYLKVIRNAASRAFEPAVAPALNPEIIFSPAVLESDYSNEYTVIAEITDGVITQCRNDEICSQEIVITDNNGVSALLPVQGNSRNSYDHPDFVGSGHPWKATPNGNNTVAIAPGLMMGLVPNPVHDPMSPSAYLLLPMEGTYVSYAGGNVTVTESTGIIYAQVVLTSDLEQANGVDPNETDHNIESALYRPSSIYAVYFSDTGIADQGGGASSVHMPIAEVTLADEIAGVALQILTHNPLIQIDSLSIESHVA